METKIKVFGIFLVCSIFSGEAASLSFDVNGTEVGVFGFAKLDVIYDLDSKLGDGINRSLIRLDGEGGADGHFDMHALSSRIGFSTSTPTEKGSLKTLIEGDFLTDGRFRLRHAYGEWNGVLAGQTWSNFNGEFLALTPVLDSYSVPSMSSTDRHSQIRYTKGKFSIAAEEPSARGGSIDVDTPYASPNDKVKDSFPDVTLRYQSHGQTASYALSALARQLGYYSDARDSEESEFGWGVGVEASLKLSPRFTVRGGVNHGDGIGGYIYLSPGDPAYVDQDGKVSLIKATGLTVGSSFIVGPGAINMVYYLVDRDLDEAFSTGAISGDSDEKIDGIYMNYIWSPVKNVSYGVEAGLHSRKTVDGREGDAIRLQGMIKYNF